MVRIYRYYVRGAGKFPFAMLWADQAWPASADDAEKITLACPTVAPEQIIGVASHAHPNTQKWKACGWPVHRVDA
jgi:hypothetical protein